MTSFGQPPDSASRVKVLAGYSLAFAVSSIFAVYVLGPSGIKYPIIAVLAVTLSRFLKKVFGG